MIEISLEKVTKIYDPGLFRKKVHAVQDLSIEVRTGEVFGLVGPNGAGKSTSIRLLLGLSRPTFGIIRFRSRLLRKSCYRKEFGYLPENPYLYDHLNLEELLAFSGRASEMDRGVAERRGQELMERLDMLESRRRPMRTFSKGMLQRAGICFALMHDPSVLILDEPMSGLDPVGRRMVFELIGELKDQGKTIFFCSHILTDVERLCDRIGVMVGGRLVRVLGREAFADNVGPSLHLVVAPLTEDQRNALDTLIGGVFKEQGQYIISFPVAALPVVSSQLSAMGVEVLGSRSGRFSLEEIFMQEVEAK
ncbi:hypothetical protein JCM30471_01290 [Desulfuromonas carbonis]|uniref:ABC transporter ATP-binding protein n=1 Tax=Desulfuromonas sp. DDH964 TaxID=1823759 RepID=UPI00078CBB2B|nr:ABC transporter ATP-binding protein [Desulfuromonas sp. DDH964]AMV71811.1 ABC transporter ATP-binding protein [Desulfuromonas sp. DDH964]